MTLAQLKKDMQELADPHIAKHSQRFFKTGKGEYGEGDQFLGIRVPVQRQVAKQYVHLSLKDVEKLLHSTYHEHRLTALIILTLKYKKCKEERKNIVDLYLKNTEYVNNWDLVDTSAHKILGLYLLDKDRSLLYTLAKSQSLWERRISIISTFAFIAKGDLDDAIALSTILVDDTHDLMHKAVGWVMREVGKKDEARLLDFLDTHAKTMPRTALRYALEKLSPKLRSHYMKI